MAGSSTRPWTAEMASRGGGSGSRSSGLRSRGSWRWGCGASHRSSDLEGGRGERGSLPSWGSSRSRSMPRGRSVSSNRPLSLTTTASRARRRRGARTVIGSGGTIQPSTREAAPSTATRSSRSSRRARSAACTTCGRPARRPAPRSARPGASARGPGRSRRGQRGGGLHPGHQVVGDRVRAPSRRGMTTSGGLVAAVISLIRSPPCQGHAKLGQTAAPSGADASDRHVQVGRERA